MNLWYLSSVVYFASTAAEQQEIFPPLKYIASKEERLTELAKPNLEHSKKRGNLGSYISKFLCWNQGNGVNYKYTTT